jgi:hypothetical protein
MALPKLVYNAGAGAVTLQFQRGPKDFRCELSAKVHDNVATSGLRERVHERADMLVSFAMPSLVVGDDYDQWAAFAAWALRGGQFDFYPNASIDYHFHCIADDDGFSPVRVAVKRYSATFAWRVVPDAAMPTSVAVVMESFYGLV